MNLEHAKQLRVQPSTFQEVYPLWQQLLWPQRKSPIKPVSPIGLDLKYAKRLEEAQPSFWILKDESTQTKGTISGYQTDTQHFRCRGLFVDPSCRGLGGSRILLQAVCKQARMEGCKKVWSLPRQSAWPAYQSFGFYAASDWISEGMEFGPNCLAFFELFSDL